MTPRTLCMLAVFALTLLAVFASLGKIAAKADGMRLPDTDMREPSLTFESISSKGMVIYQAEFWRGYVAFNRTSLGRDGTAEFHSFRLRY